MRAPFLDKPTLRFRRPSHESAGWLAAAMVTLANAILLMSIGLPMLGEMRQLKNDLERSREREDAIQRENVTQAVSLMLKLKELQGGK